MYLILFGISVFLFLPALFFSSEMKDIRKKYDFNHSDAENYDGGVKKFLSDNTTLEDKKKYLYAILGVRICLSIEVVIMIIFLVKFFSY